MNIETGSLTVNRPQPVFSPHSSIIDESERFRKTIAALNRFPFLNGDTTVGMEYELQVAIQGSSEDVDLPLSIRQSSYYHNIEKRVARGDLSSNTVSAIQQFIEENPSNIWENSWVRLSEDHLCPYARKVLAMDFLADKELANGPRRSDVANFYTVYNQAKYLRVPVSYLLKMALADALGRSNQLPKPLLQTGEQVLTHYLSDNTSPEVLSLTIPSSSRGSIGKLAAAETSRTFLLTQLLTQYANSSFGLLESGQKCLIYNAPNAPLRQKQLNNIIPDSYYRQLFLSPCLSGWDRGEEKHDYMSLCHKVLSRSQLNTIGKLKEAGIIVNNLVVLPNTSNTCLANNGTHVSLGSQLLTGFATDPKAAFTPQVEKYFGDLVIKIVEHFLPLLVNTYSGAPYRVDFGDFHPENMLGFLPHELDYTHLRMLWRRWKKKADISFMGRPLTPFGPHRLDWFLSRVLRLHGDLVPDFRLIDYMVTLLSTDTSPALDGVIGNQERLKRELGDMGVFDARMSIYLPYRMREFSRMGYSGFEGRNYSLFPSISHDMGDAVELQNLITALAYRYVLRGEVRHDDIPDSPVVESERRQLFFGCAIGIPTVYIRKDTSNSFLSNILAQVRSKRNSRRYKNYIRVKIKEYQLALINLLHRDGADIIEGLGASAVIDNLLERIAEPSESAAFRLISGTRQLHNPHKQPEKIPAALFNNQSEEYYRTTLKKLHLREGLQVLKEGCAKLEKENHSLLKEVMQQAGQTCSAVQLINKIESDILSENAEPDIIRLVINICLTLIYNENNLENRNQ